MTKPPPKGRREGWEVEDQGAAQMFTAVAMLLGLGAPVAKSVLFMANQPLNVNIYHLMVMATDMPYAGRG